MSKLTRGQAVALVGQNLINELDSGWDFSGRLTDNGMTEFVNNISSDKFSVTGYVEFDSDFFEENSGRFVRELDLLDWTNAEYMYEIEELN